MDENSFAERQNCSSERSQCKAGRPWSLEYAQMTQPPRAVGRWAYAEYPDISQDDNEFFVGTTLAVVRMLIFSRQAYLSFRYGFAVHPLTAAVPSVTS